MTMIRGRRAFAILVGAAFVMLAAGCALSPQNVEIEPVLAVDAGDLGNGRSIALDVIDNRAEKTIGSRGGIYENTSTISTGTDIRAAVRRALADALMTQGFNIVGAGQSADLRMVVGLDELTYTAKGDPIVRSVEVGTAVSSTVERDGRSYTGRAHISRMRQVLRAPAPEDNEAYINDAIAQALEKLLADPRFVEFVR